MLVFMANSLSHEDRIALAGILQRNGVAQHDQDVLIDIVDNYVQFPEYNPNFPKQPLTLDVMTDIHMARSRWLDKHRSPDSGRNEGLGGSWRLTEWTNAIAGEAGEACNIAKKIRRGDFLFHELPGAYADLVEELADVLAYLNLTCGHFGMDLEDAVVHKFNQSSEKFGYPGRMQENDPQHKG